MQWVLLPIAVFYHEPSCFHQAGSLDEAYLDVTDLATQRNMTGAELRDNVQNKTGLICSVGIAPNKRLAKV